MTGVTGVGPTPFQRTPQQLPEPATPDAEGIVPRIAVAILSDAPPLPCDIHDNQGECRGDRDRYAGPGVPTSHLFTRQRPAGVSRYGKELDAPGFHVVPISPRNNRANLPLFTVWPSRVPAPAVETARALADRAG